MRRNRMRKSTRDPFSGTRRKAGAWALCILAAAAAACMTCAVILPAMTAGPETRESFAREQARLNDSYEAETGGFVRDLAAKQAGAPRAEKKGKASPVRAPAWSPAALSAVPGEIDAKTDGLPSVSPELASPQEEPQVELHVEAVTEGAYYEALMTRVAEEADGWTVPPQVMELTASLDGRKLDLSGCQITVQVDPNRARIEAAMEDAAAAASQEEESGGGEKPGMVLTVLPLGGESVVRLFTSEEMESGEALPAVAVTYTVPEGAPALYAVSTHTAQVYRTVDGGRQMVVEGEMIIDLEGCVTECAAPLIPATDTETGEPYDANSFLFLVKSGATLTITDSGAGGGITANGLSSLITVETGGTLNIQGGTLRNNGGGASRVIFADGTSTVNMSGGTITGGKIWTGAGIYMADGTVNIYDGEITNNTADTGGGVYANTGTVNIYSGRIANNTAAVYGGGVYANSGAVNIYGGEITDNTAVGGGGVCALDGRVVMQKGTISNNKAGSDWEGGGGVYAKTMELSGGGIRGNEALYSGGGIYIKESVTMTGGEISGNHVTGSNPNARGGGVSADLMIMSGGEISGNTTPAKGGGVYTTRMMMTNGTVSGNKVLGTNAVGGGGIFIAQGTPVFNDGGMAEHGIYSNP